MPAAPLPDNEAERLADLDSFEILDTAPDLKFDAFARMAAQFYRVPVALIALLDRDRNWFKAAVGVPISESPREFAFCAHAILAPGDVMIVEDATRDARFADNPLVTGAPGVRFYAGAPIISPAGLPLGTLCLFDLAPRALDFGERQRLADLALGVGALLDLHRGARRVERARTHDPLTGLANRDTFEAAADSAAVGSAPDGPGCAVLCLDLDHFRALNDRLGHETGNALLRSVAERLARLIRPGDLVARLGGDAFAVLLEGRFPASTPRLVAERIMAGLAEPLDLPNGQRVALACSVGHATAPADATDGPALIRAAETALFRAKAAGRGTVVAAAELPAAVLGPRARTLADDIRAALRDDAFVLHWQPYITADTGDVAGHEALIRWERPGHGILSPSVFIPAAEQAGLIGEIDAWVLRTACVAAASWPVPQRVSVNISPHWFAHGDPVRLVVDVLARTGLDPARLVLEVTERSFIDQPDLARARIAQLHGLGVALALDDFGTGYSALAALKNFDFDTLKLDRAFVCDIGTDIRADDIVRAVLAFARALRLQVCAEGVETAAQLDFLRAEGCALLQGFFLARPAAEPVFDIPGLRGGFAGALHVRPPTTFALHRERLRRLRG